MDLATGAMSSLLPKLVELLSDEYELQKGVKKSVKSLEKEMRSMNAALRKVAEVPWDQLDEQVKLWAGEVRDLSFDMEDIVDNFLVRVDDDSSATKSNKLKQLTEKMAAMFTKGKARHEIGKAIKDINKQVQEVANRRERYAIDNIVSRPVATIDPRIGAMYKEVTELVGITGKRDQDLMNLLSDGENDTKNKLKIVSVVGFGGLGKTTLVKTVYDKIKGGFDCTAFVPVGRNADVKKIFMDILIDLNMYESHFTILDERQLIDRIRESLKNKRYLVVIDDIWNEEQWHFINMAFSSSNNIGSRLITTTRIVSLSKFICSSADDLVYQMEPLSGDDSKRLFYKRIFSDENGCPRDFEEVSTDILKKCGGVPLAIITVASLLAGDQQVKPVDEWQALRKSIGRGLTEDASVEEMLKILSFSYYDLPSHLKTCLLYLSMFPEDHKIEKDKLIWMWISESFVQIEKAKTSLFEIGETYFNELVNRNMVMPVYNYDDTAVVACRVHDMVHDLIYSLSSKVNFVTVLNGADDSMSSQSNVRRLSLQGRRKGETRMESGSMFQVRSVATFGTGMDLMPSISRFAVLRVLDLSDSDLRDYDERLNLRDSGSILHLRYLSLSQTRIHKVPKEVGKLQFLQVLDLRGNDLVELPSTVINLRRLMCLLIDNVHKRLPDGLGNLTSMEALGVIRCDSLSIVKELGRMERMRVLGILFDNLSLEMEKAFLESLSKLSNIQRLRINSTWTGEPMDLLGEHWLPSGSLQEFTAVGWEPAMFSTMPACISRDPSHLSQLTILAIEVRGVRQEDVGILGMLPALRSLDLYTDRWTGQLLVGADGFRCLTAFYLRSKSPGQIVFQTGAMPKAEIIELCTTACHGGDCSDLGMGNLLSLRTVDVTFQRSGLTVREAKQAEVALANALRAHPNRPTFDITLIPSIREDALDDDVCP